MQLHHLKHFGHGERRHAASVKLCPSPLPWAGAASCSEPPAPWLPAAFPRPSANVPVPYDWNASPPSDNRAAYIQWMQANRGEDPKFLGERFDRFLALVGQATSGTTATSAPF